MDAINGLVSITDLNVAVPDDGSLGVDAAQSLLTGRRADLLPQRDSAVASVATLLGADSTVAPAVTGSADARLNHLLINPLSATSSAAPGRHVVVAAASGEHGGGDREPDGPGDAAWGAVAATVAGLGHRGGAPAAES